jgi:uncharacterized protein
MSASNPSRTTFVALLFEGGLGTLALAAGWLVGHSPAVGMTAGDGTREQLLAIGWGLVATGPLVAALAAIDRFPIGPLAGVREMTARIALQMFQGASVLQLAIVSIAAGVGEELLFRGLMQAGLEKLLEGWYAPWIALAASATLFGICHWLNRTYAILAVLAGAYFGVLLIISGSLLTPIVAHAAYDLLALIYLVRPSHLVRLT